MTHSQINWCCGHDEPLDEAGKCRKCESRDSLQRLVSGHVEYKTILADPPWEYRHKVTGRNGRGAACHHYPTMTMREIVEMKLPPIAKDAFLWLWVTNPVMAEGWHSEIIKAWGFKPQSVLTWVKSGIGMGYTLRSATEHLIVARRGHPKVNHRGVPTWFKAARMRHSAKPEEAQDIVEKICDGPYLELFARRKRPGWHSWGNEIQNDVNVVTANAPDQRPAE